MAKNVLSLQLLRNSTVFTTKELAIAGITGSTTQDGVIKLARYTEDNKTKTIFGIYHDFGSGNAGYTIYDSYQEAIAAMRDQINAISAATSGASITLKDVQDMLGSGVTTGNSVTEQLEALSGNAESKSADTSVAGAKKYADEKVAEELSKLTATTVADDNKIVSDVTQTNGKITATAKNVTEVKLAGLSATADTKIASTDTLGDALAKLQGQIDSMDKTASSADGEVVITVVETDGKVTEEKSKLKDVLLTGYAKTNDTGDIAATDSVNVALSKLENKAAAITITNDDKSINVTTSTTGTNINVNIKDGEHVLAKDGNAGIYTNIALSSITPSSTTVKEEYQLTATDGSKLGETIKIYKDSSISKIYLGYPTDTVDAETGVITSGTTGEAQSLNYVYHKEDGKYEMVHVDVSKFLVESEFASGVTADATGVVHGVVDANSEKDSQATPVDFLTVGENGFKVSGIKDEIDRKINALDATGGTQTIAADNHVAVEVIEADGKITTVTVVENNIADADDLAELSGKTVTEVASSNNSITAALSAATDGTKHLDIITDASKIKMSGFTNADVLSGIAESSSVTEAFLEVDKVITANEQTTAAALNDLKATKLENIVVNGVTGTTGANNTTSVTVDGSQLNLSSGYTKAAQAAAVATGDTVDVAIGKLEKGLEAAVSGGVQSVVPGTSISVDSTDTQHPVVNLNLKANDGSGDNDWHNPLQVDSATNSLYFNSLDCGTY